MEFIMEVMFKFYDLGYVYYESKIYYQGPENWLASGIAHPIFPNLSAESRFFSEILVALLYFDTSLQVKCDFWT